MGRVEHSSLPFLRDQLPFASLSLISSARLNSGKFVLRTSLQKGQAPVI